MGWGLAQPPLCLPWLVGRFSFPSPEQGLALRSWLPGMLGTLPLPLSLGQPPPSPLLSHSLFGVLAGGGGQPPLSPCSPTRGTWPSLAPGEPEGPSLLVASCFHHPLRPSSAPSAPPSNLLASFLPLLALGPTAGDGEDLQREPGVQVGRHFQVWEHSAPLLFPHFQLPHPHSFKFCAAGCQPDPLGDTPQVRIGGEGGQNKR